jgi:hypothetical protein
MTTYVFKAGEKSTRVTHIPKRPRCPKRPSQDREHLESTMRKWSMSTKQTAQQRISLRAWELQLASGRVATRSSCGHGLYKVLIPLPFLEKAFVELY